MPAPAHSAQDVPANYLRTGIYSCAGLVTPALKRGPVSKWHGGYSRQYRSTHSTYFTHKLTKLESVMIHHCKPLLPLGPGLVSTSPPNNRATVMTNTHPEARQLLTCRLSWSTRARLTDAGAQWCFWANCPIRDRHREISIIVLHERWEWGYWIYYNPHRLTYT